MGKLGISLCWRLIAAGSLDAIQEHRVTEEMLRPPANRAFALVLEHFRKYGVMPARETILEAAEVDPDFDHEPPEPAAYYAEAVVKRSIYNEQRSAAKKLGEALQQRDPTTVHDAAREIFSVGAEKLDTAGWVVVDQRKNTDERLKRYEMLKSFDGGIRGVRSPWGPVDAETGGWKDGDLVTFVARLGLGKTWSAVINAVEAGRQGRVVGFVSPEMSRSALELRRDAALYQVPYRDLLRGELDAPSELRYTEALRAETEKPSSSAWFTTENISNVVDVELFVQQYGINFLVVDGLYLLDVVAPKKDDKGGGSARMATLPWHERIMLIARSLKRLAMRRKIPVLATTQFNRSVRTGAMKAGSEAIGHSDAIAQFSDVVIGLFQDEMMRDTNQMHLRMLKNREGRPIELSINWDLVNMNFSALGSASPAPGPGAGGNDDFPDTMF